MATLLVTAFGAFPGAPSNPSREILADLERHWRGRFSRMGVRLVTAVLPVVHAVAPLVDALVAREAPDAIVHLGLAARRRGVNVECRARNRATMLKPDARGAFARTRAHRAGAPASLPTAWDAPRLVAGLRAEGVDATEHHVVDRVRVDAGALDERPDRVRAEVGRVHLGEPAVAPADRRADRVDDVGLGHVVTPSVR